MDTLVQPSRPVSVQAANRLHAVDVVRGLAIVLMALDHVREFLPTVVHDPLDPDKTSLALFVTRWITHLCAPTFAFLAGMSAGLVELRGMSRSDLSRFHFKRGLWLAILEFTFITWFGWDFWFQDTFSGR